MISSCRSKMPSQWDIFTETNYIKMQRDVESRNVSEVTPYGI